jgi:hypothetical protein
MASDHIGEGDLHAGVPWRTIEARLTTRRGNFELAERLAREALGMINQTDAICQRAKVHLDLAQVLRLADREAEACEAAEAAIALYEAKGNVAAAMHARTFLSVDAVV